MFELTLVPMYFLISGWGYANRVYAALKFFIYTLAGSAFLLVGILAVVFLTSSGGHPSFDLIEVARRTSQLTQTEQRLIFLSFIVAFAVKTPLFPLHTWLPDAHTEAPTAGSVILAAVLLKLGTYGILRFGVFLFPKAAVDLGPILLTSAVIGMTYGAIVAAMQKDLKRLIAYSSVAHLGFIVLGIFAFTSQGLSGGVLQMVNHGLSTGALFLLVGMIYERRHTRQISELHGLQKSVPVMAAVFLVVMMSSVGLPGLNGFVGEFLVLLGTFITHRWWAVVGSTGVILAAVYLLWAYQRVFHGVPEGDNATMLDMTLREKAMMAPLLLGIVFLGIYPKPVLDRIQPSVDHLIAHVQHSDPSLHLPAKGVGPVVAVGPADDVDSGSRAIVSGSPAAAATTATTATTGAPRRTAAPGAHHDRVPRPHWWPRPRPAPTAPAAGSTPCVVQPRRPGHGAVHHRQVAAHPVPVPLRDARADPDRRRPAHPDRLGAAAQALPPGPVDADHGRRRPGARWPGPRCACGTPRRPARRR